MIAPYCTMVLRCQGDVAHVNGGPLSLFFARRPSNRGETVTNCVLTRKTGYGSRFRGLVVYALCSVVVVVVVVAGVLGVCCCWYCKRKYDVVLLHSPREEGE